MSKVVISEQFGGFGLSAKAIQRLRELGWQGERDYDANDLPRDDSRLVQAVEELGDDASAWAAELVVIEIPDGVAWHVHEYDGYETIHEDHRSWSSDGEYAKGC